VIAGEAPVGVAASEECVDKDAEPEAEEQAQSSAQEDQLNAEQRQPSETSACAEATPTGHRD